MVVHVTKYNVTGVPLDWGDDSLTLEISKKHHFEPYNFSCQNGNLFLDRYQLAEFPKE